MSTREEYFSTLKTLNLLSYHSEDILNRLIDNKEQVSLTTRSKEYDVFSIKVKNEEYTLIIGMHPIFKTLKSELPLMVFFKGKVPEHFSKTELEELAILSFPYWKFKNKSIDEYKNDQAVYDFLKRVEKNEIFTDNIYARYNSGYKFNSLNFKYFEDIIKLGCDDKLYLEIKDSFTFEKNILIEQINMIKNEIEKIFNKNKMINKYWQDEGNILFFKDNDVKYYSLLKDEYGFFIKEDSENISLSVVNLFKNSMTKLETHLPEEISQNKKEFIKWLEDQKVDLIITNNDFTFDEPQQLILRDLLIAFSLETNYLMITTKSTKEYFIKSEEELYDIELFYKSKLQLLGFLFFSQNDFYWKDGMLIEKNRIFPYQQNSGLPDYLEAEMSPFALCDQYNGFLINRVPDNIVDELKKPLKDSFNNLKEGRYPNITIEDDMISSIEKRLNELNIL